MEKYLKVAKDVERTSLGCVFIITMYLRVVPFSDYKMLGHLSKVAIITPVRLRTVFNDVPRVSRCWRFCDGDRRVGGSFFWLW